MTRTAIYDAKTNSLVEQPEHPEPNKYLSALGGILNEWYPKQKREYDEYIASLRTIPCHESCRGVWVEGQMIEEGKDYKVKIDVKKRDNEEYFVFTAFPLTSKSEEDLWREVFERYIDKFCALDAWPTDWEDCLKFLRKYYNVTRK